MLKKIYEFYDKKLPWLRSLYLLIRKTIKMDYYKGWKKFREEKKYLLRMNIRGGEKGQYKLNLYSWEQIKVGIGGIIDINSDIFLHYPEDGCQQYDVEKFIGKLRIGDYTTIGYNLKIDCYSSITIGDNCMISNNLSIMDSNHGMNPELPSYHRQPRVARQINIGNGCWIGERVTLLQGANIGDHCIIGTNAVVTGTIPAYSIAAGIPARIIKTWNFKTKLWDRV